jgi:hypothetical protein
MVKLEFLKISLFLRILKKFNTFIFWCMVILLDPDWDYTYEGAQRLCKLIFFLKKPDHESWTIKSDHGKGHFLWSDFMVQGVDQPSLKL